MTKLSREQLIEELERRIAVTTQYPGVEEAQLDAAIFKIALASLEAEPVAINDDMAYAFHHALSDAALGADEVEEIKTGLRAAFANVAAPQPVAVPDDDKTNMLCDSAYVNGLQAGFSMGQMNQEAEYAQTVEHYRKGIREYRAAMLNAEPVSQPYKLVGEVVAWNHPNHERNVDFRWLAFNVEPGTKLYAIKQERS